MNDAHKKAVYYGRQAQITLDDYSPPIPADLDRFQGTWKDHVAAAKFAWGLLSERELVRSEGHPETLKWLIQCRYTMSPRDSSHYVEQFIRGCGY